MDVTLPSGVVIRDVPAGTDKSEIKARALAAGLATEQDFLEQQPAIEQEYSIPAINRTQTEIQATNGLWLDQNLVKTNPVSMGTARDVYLDIDGSTDSQMYGMISSANKKPGKSFSLSDWSQRIGLVAGAKVTGGLSEALSGVAEMGVTGGEQVLDSADWLMKQSEWYASKASEYEPTTTETIPEEMIADAFAAPWKATLGGAAGITQVLAATDQFFLTVFQGKGVYTSPFWEISSELNKTVQDINAMQSEQKQGFAGDDPSVIRGVVSAVSQTAFDIGANIKYMQGVTGAKPWRTQDPGLAARQFGDDIFKMTGSDVGASKAAVAAQRIIDSVKYGAARFFMTYGTAAERAKTAAITTAYMSTTAFSGWIDNKFGRVIVDFLGNTGISSAEYKRVMDSDMSGREKFLALLPTLLSDGFFSARTAPLLRDAGAGADVMSDFDEMARLVSLDLQSPRNTGVELPVNPVAAAKQRAVENGRGGFKVYEAEKDAQKTLDETKVQLEREIAELKQTEEKPGEEKPAPAIAEGQTAKPAEAKDAPKPVEEKTPVEIARREAVLDVIKDTEGQPQDARLDAVSVRLQQLGETLADDAPIKTQINRINRVRKPVQRETMTESQFYREMEKVADAAVKSGVGRVDETLAGYKAFANENLPWREAEAVIARLEAGVSKHPTPDGFAKFAERTLEKAYSPKKTIERTIPIKDLSDKVEMSESELLRTVLRAQQSAATGAKRATIDDITRNNKAMNDTLKSLPPDLRTKVLRASQRVIEAKTDEAREKRLNEFGERVDDILVHHKRKASEQAYNKAMSGAKKLIANRKTKKWFRDNLEAALGLKDLPQQRDTDSLERRQILSTVADLKEYTAGNKDNMTADELAMIAGMVNHLVKTHNQVVKEEAQYNKSKAEHDVEQQLQRVSIEPKDLSMRGKEGGRLEQIGGYAKRLHDMQLIPQGLAEILDYRKTTGMFQSVQEDLRNGVRKEAELLSRVMDVLDPHEAMFTKINYKKNGDAKTISTAKETYSFGVADRMRIYLGSKDPYTKVAMKDQGISWGLGKQSLKMNGQLIDRVIGMMSKEEVESAEAVLRAYRVMGDMTSRFSIDYLGYDITPNKDYSGRAVRVGSSAEAKVEMPEMTIDLEKGIGLSQAFMRHSLENAGSFKERTGSTSPILLYNPLDMLRSQMRLSGKVYGYAEPLDRANRLMYYAKRKGLKESYAQKGRTSAFNNFEEYLNKLNDTSGKTGKGDADKLAGAVVKYAMEYTAGTLKINPKVGAYQKASFYLVKGDISQEAYRQAFLGLEKDLALGRQLMGKAQKMRDEMSEYPYLKMRYRGRMGIAVGDQARTKKQQRGMQLIINNDTAVIYHIFKGVQFDVAKKGLSGVEAKDAIEKKMVELIENTQPSYEETARPALGRADSDIVRRLMMFQSARSKVFYKADRSAGLFLERLRSDEKITKKDMRSILAPMSSVLKSTATIAAIQTGFEQLTFEVADATGVREKKRFDSDEDRMLYYVKEFGQNWLFSFAGSMGAITSLGTSWMEGYQFEAIPIASFARDLGASYDVLSMAADYLDAVDEGTEEEWLEENRIRFGEKLSRVSNTVVMPTTGVNVKNAYKWMLETPAVLLDKEGRRDRQDEWEMLSEDERFIDERNKWQKQIERIFSDEND